MANINVTMTVDTSALTPGCSQQTIDAACTLTDDSGDPSGHQNFIVNAQQGDTVTYSITAENSVTPVAYSAFRYKSGTQGVFSPLPASSNSWVGTIETGQVNVSESYYIDFTSNGNPYTLDPQIDVDPRP